MIEINIRIVAEPAEPAAFKEVTSRVFKDFYKKYQEFDNVLVEEEVPEAVERITEDILDGVLQTYSICFIGLHTQRKRAMAGRRSSLRPNDPPEQYCPEQQQLIRVTFQELKKKIAADDRELQLVCSIVELRKNCAKDILKLSMSSQRDCKWFVKAAQHQYINNEHCEAVSSTRVTEFEELVQNFQRACRFQEKLKPRRTEPVAVVLKLSVSEISSEVLIHHVLFVEIGELIRSPHAFEDGEVMMLFDRFLQGRPDLQQKQKHKFIDYLQGVLIETSRLSLTVYSGINDLPQQQLLLSYLSQLKVHASISMMNGRSHEQNTVEMIERVSHQLVAVRQKAEIEQKQFRHRLSLIEEMLGTTVQMDKLGTKGFLSESLTRFRKQREAADTVDSMRKSNAEQQRRLLEISKQLKNKKATTEDKRSKNASAIRKIKEQIREQEQLVNHIPYCIQQKTTDLLQREKLQLNRLSQSRQERMQHYRVFADRLNRTNKKQQRICDQKTRELNSCSRAAFQANDDFSKLVLEHTDNNKRLVGKVRKELEDELKEFEKKLIQQHSSNRQPVQSELLLMATIYEHYRHNQELLGEARRHLPADSSARRLIDEAGRLDIRQFPLLSEGLNVKEQQLRGKSKK